MWKGLSAHTGKMRRASPCPVEFCTAYLIEHLLFEKCHKKSNLQSEHTTVPEFQPCSSVAISFCLSRHVDDLWKATFYLQHTEKNVTAKAATVSIESAKRG
jgi:hypothetical protein